LKGQYDRQAGQVKVVEWIRWGSEKNLTGAYVPRAVNM
jgi:hypothetical protein